MDYLKFLANCSDENLRKKFWELFNQVEPEAKWYGHLYSNWIKITSIESHAKDAVWVSYVSNGITYAKITIPTKWNDLGVIFHEMFHSAFHHSPLWRNSQNKKWGDAFCNAFRYYMEKKLLKSTPWLTNFRKTSPTYKIMVKTDWDYETFKELWKIRNQNPHIPLDNYF